MTSAIKMNNFLLNKLNERKYLIDFNKISKYLNENVGDTSNPHFYLKEELKVKTVEEYRVAKQLGEIRHVVEYKGKWFDYIVKREFKTLSEWAIDAGGTINDVLYGTNRANIGHKPVFVTLDALLDHLGYVHPPTVDIPTYKSLDTFSDIAKELKMSDEPKTSRFLVYNPISDTIIIASLIDWKKYAPAFKNNTPSKMCLVYQENIHESTKIYSSISEMPEGTEIYFDSIGQDTYISLKKVLNIQ